MGVAEGRLKGDKPEGALIGGASMASWLAVLNNGDPAAWNGDCAGGDIAEVACMTVDRELALGCPIPA